MSKLPENMRSALAFSLGWVCATAFALAAARFVSDDDAIVSSGILAILFLATGAAYARFVKGAGSAHGEGPSEDGAFEHAESTPVTLSRRCEAYSRMCGMTPRQGEVLGLLAEGRSVEVVADELYLSRETVKSHVKAIYAKAGVHSRQELIAAVYGSDAVDLSL